MQRTKTFLLISLLLAMLVAVRWFELDIFYDPLLAYFRSDYTDLPIPVFNPTLLFLSLGFRYILNSAISIAIIHLIFRNADLTKFSIMLFLILMALLMIAMATVLCYFSDEKMFIFYIRRFLIQPIFLILFIPAFYFQQRAEGNKM